MWSLFRHLAYEGPRHRYDGSTPPGDIYTFLSDRAHRRIERIDADHWRATGYFRTPTDPLDRCTTPDAAGPARTAPTTSDPFPTDPTGPDMHAVALRYFRSRPGWGDPHTYGSRT